MKSEYSDEMINAFVDGELDSRDRDGLKLAMQDDPYLHDRVTAICELKKSLQASYASVSAHLDESSSDKSKTRMRRNSTHGLAAAMLLCVGAVFGWFGQLASQQTDRNIVRLEGVQLNPLDLHQTNKIVLHVSSSEGNKLEQTINKVEYIINQYESRHMPFQLEVVANSGGIDLLRDDVSPYKERILSIMQRYNNVSFIACSNAISRLKMQGVEPKIIAHSTTGVTAVERIVKRLQEGWVYVKV